MNYETFKRYLFADLVVRKLLYRFDVDQWKKTDQGVLEQDEPTVEGILFNHISLDDYRNDFIYLNIEKFIEILEFIKKTKLAEIGLDERIPLRAWWISNSIRERRPQFNIAPILRKYWERMNVMMNRDSFLKMKGGNSFIILWRKHYQNVITIS